MDNEFGYTNDPKELDAVIAFRNAAIADGWLLEAVYDTEPADSYGKLSKDGFLMHANARDKEREKEWNARIRDQPYKYRYQCQIAIWGPDGLCIETPATYDWQVIKAGQTRCDSCGATGVPTQRYHFAGRCCAACLPAMRAKHETRGWCD